MKKIEIYTDGACCGNPGRGGWGAILCGEFGEVEISGGEESTTNNRMELMAAIQALQKVDDMNINSECEISIYTDSQYVKSGITDWIKNWIKKEWRNSQKQPVKNKELWQKLLALSAGKNISWHWIRGHVGHEFNERADKLARSQCK